MKIGGDRMTSDFMKELLSKIQEVYATFSTDAALQIEKGNN